MTLAIVIVFPEPVTPSNVWKRSPRSRPAESSAIARGWSPAGRNGAWRSNRGPAIEREIYSDPLGGRGEFPPPNPQGALGGGMTTYRLLMSGRPVAEFRDGESGGASLKIPGSHKVGDVTLKRGVILDSSLANWLKSANTKHHLVIQLRNEVGQVAGS